MGTKKAPNRYRFSVPEDDKSVTEWIGKQNSLSTSIRQLIKDAIRKYGQQDITCLPVEQYEKRGRPSNAELAERAQAQPERPTKKLAAKQETPQTVAPAQPVPVAQAPDPAPQPVAPPQATPVAQPKPRDPEKPRLPEVDDDGDSTTQLLGMLSISK